MRNRVDLILILLSCLYGCSTQEESVLPEVGGITESVYASGVIMAEGQYLVRSQIAGEITEVLVQAGDTVKAGTGLFVLDDEQARLSAENAKITFDLSKDQSEGQRNKLNDLEQKVRLTRKALEVDSSLFARQQRLWDQGIGSRNELDQRELAYYSSQSAFRSAKISYNDLRKQLAAATAQSALNLRQTETNRAHYTITSDIDGVVYDVLPKQGELVSTQNTLAVVGHANRFEIELQVDEIDIGRIRIGQLVLLSLDSQGEQVFEANVTRINPIMNERSRTFLVIAAFRSPPPLLYPFLTAEANIIVREKSNALLIPASYLIGDTYVLTGKTDTVRVETGLRDFEKVEILSGISPATRLYKPGTK